MPGMSTTTFQVGQRYACRSLGDYDCIWTFTVTKRSAKFVTLTQDSGETHRVGVRLWDDVEVCSPFGRYSLSPVLSADRVVECEHHGVVITDGNPYGHCTYWCEDCDRQVEVVDQTDRDGDIEPRPIFGVVGS